MEQFSPKPAPCLCLLTKSLRLTALFGALGPRDGAQACCQAEKRQKNSGWRRRFPDLEILPRSLSESGYRSMSRMRAPGHLFAFETGLYDVVHVGLKLTQTGCTGTGR